MILLPPLSCYRRSLWHFPCTCHITIVYSPFVFDSYPLFSRAIFYNYPRFQLPSPSLISDFWIFAKFVLWNRLLYSSDAVFLANEILLVVSAFSLGFSVRNFILLIFHHSIYIVVIMLNIYFIIPLSLSLSAFASSAP